MNNPMTVERESERELVITRTFKSPAHIVFEAWTKPELLKRWRTCEADVRTGGTYRFVFSHAAAEQPMAFFGRYDAMHLEARAGQANSSSCWTRFSPR